jgi:hypothetical protein
MSIVGAGVVNDPANKSLRFDMLKFGLESFCTEMTKAGTPLKLADDQPVVGRFFAEACQTTVLDEESRKSFIVQYRGKGYAWGSPVGRVGFTATGLVEYAPDFQLHEGTLYVYFRPRLVDTSSFQAVMVESQLAQSALGALGMTPEALGKRVVDGQLRRGFTVLRYDADGAVEFGMGMIPPGERPYRPYQVTTEDKTILVNDRTEVHTGQQDYIGAFEVTEEDQAFYFTLTLDGTPAVDVLLLPAVTGDVLVDGYVRSPGARPLPGPALLDEVLPAGQTFKRFVPVNPGRYYLMLDHSDQAGHGPKPDLTADRPGKIDYLVMIGEAP